VCTCDVRVWIGEFCVCVCVRERYISLIVESL